MSVVQLDESVSGTVLESPVGYVGADWVEADNLRSRDPQLVATAELLESAAEIGSLCQSVFELGASVWLLSQSRQISTDLSDQIDRFRSEVQMATVDAVNAIGEQVDAVTEPDDGVLASAVQREVAGLKLAIAQAFDAHDKTSAPAVSRRACPTWPPLRTRRPSRPYDRYSTRPPRPDL
jgi:hypothetical protein